MIGQLAYLFETNAKVALLLQQIQVELEAQADRDEAHITHCIDQIFTEVETAQQHAASTQVELKAKFRREDGRRFRMRLMMSVDRDPEAGSDS